MLLKEWPRLPSTARIGRAQSYRARSASKEGAWPLLPHPPGARNIAGVVAWLSTSKQREEIA